MVIKQIRDFCNENKLLEEGDKVLLGLSGGADSVCLLFALLELKDEYGLDVAAVHVHHGIRGEEADRDALFCTELCRTLGVGFRVEYIDIPAMARASGETLEEAGRKARYELFNRIAEDESFDKIAVAHHRNDQAETVLFQMIRGSRLTGLAGIKPQNGQIIRPLLCLDRNEILEYLSENNHQYVTDSTNLENDASRNILRNDVMARLLDIQSGAVDHICETAEYLGRVDAYLEKQAGKLYDRAVHATDDRAAVSIKELEAEDSLLVEMVLYRVLCSLSGRKKDITHRHVESAMALMTMQTGAKADFKYGISGQKAFESLVFTTKNRFDNDIVNCDNTISAGTSVHILTVDRRDKESTEELVARAGGFGDGRRKKLLDMESLQRVYPGLDTADLVLRYAGSEDYITVYRDGRKKKVFDLLMEAKVPLDERGRCLVAAYDREAFIIKDFRGCESYRVTDNTRKILVINI